MLRVLVVEDEEMIRKGIVLAVDWAALDCVIVGEAANGEEGLEAVERLQPSLIITDLKMPKMDGLEMVSRLRESGNSVFVIILTAYDSFAYAQSALRLGAVDFLLKPFHDGDLEKAVLTLQGRLKAQSERTNAASGVPGVKKGGKSRYVLEAMDYIGQNYLTRYRIHKAMELLRQGRLKVYEVAEAVGYRDIAYFSATYKKVAGMSPSEYQDSQA